MTRYLIRLDDACPTMNAEKWRRIEALLDSYGIKPLVGIIPNNGDPMQMIDVENTSFWDMARIWQGKGWSIALHGYDHCYITDKGMMGLNPMWPSSEFVGLPLEVQKEKIRKGYDILKENKLSAVCFFAPSHTYDENTLIALREESDIRIISDTIATKPYLFEGFSFVPQICARCINFHFPGIYTFCFHPSVMGDEDFLQLESFLRKYSHKFVCFEDLELSDLRGKSLLDKMCEKVYFAIRRIKRGIFMVSKKICHAIRDPFYICQGVLKKISPLIKDDETYVRLRYFFCTHKRLHLKNPISFNEKMQWLKLYGHRPEYTLLADKYAVKQIVAGKIGEQYVVPCLAVWDNPEQIDISSLPQQFVIKANFNSSGNLGVCRDKSAFDIQKYKMATKNQFVDGYYGEGRDKQYRDIEKKVFAEAFLDDGRKGELQDYKFWCFDGVPKYMYITNKGVEIFENFYDMEFNPVMIDHGYPRHLPEYDKPVGFEEMKLLAASLSKGIPFVRVDFFEVGGKVFFSEYTFFDWGGFRPFGGEWDEKLGRLLVLPKEK